MHVLLISVNFPVLLVFFLFDNAPSHQKYPRDGLNPAYMNVYPGGKQAITRDTEFGMGKHKKWSYQMAQPGE